MIRSTLLFASVLLVFGCAATHVEPASSTSTSAELPPSSILGRWKLVTVNGISAASAKVIVVFEADGSYRRQVSCNQGIGTYSVTGGILTLGAVGETEKGCEPYQNEALIDEAVRVGPWTVRWEGNDVLLLYGRHQLRLERMS